MMVAPMRGAKRIATALFPAPVGPQITGTSGSSAPSKAPLELIPRQIHDRAAAMHVMGWERRGRERDEEGAHLLRRERITRLDRGLARHRRRESLVSSMQSGRAIAAQRSERLAQTPLRIEARVRHGDAPHEKGVAAKALDLEAEPLEERAMRVESLRFRRAEMQRKWKEEPLRRRVAALQRSHEALVQHTFVCRVLVDEHDAVIALEHDVGAPELQEWRHLDGRHGGRGVFS